MIHAPGRCGTPSRSHATIAAANASCTASSASWKSPTWRMSVASTAARSSRKAASAAAVLAGAHHPAAMPVSSKTTTGRTSTDP